MDILAQAIDEIGITESQAVAILRANTTKPYLMFGSPQCYYAGGGWSDYVGSFESVEEIVATWQQADEMQWYQCVEFATGRVVRGSVERPHGSGWRFDPDVEYDKEIYCDKKLSSFKR
jgi:hypothetical protein